MSPSFGKKEHPGSSHSWSHDIQLKIVFLFVPFFISPGLSLAQVSFSGFGATGLKFFNREVLKEYDQVAYYEGKLQANIVVNKQIEAQLDFRGNSEDNSINFREFSAKFEYSKKLKFKVGNLKIPFGLEQMLERDEYYTVDHSYIHRTIDNFGYGGRSVSVMAYYKFSEKREQLPYSYYLSFFRNNSQVTGAAARFSYHDADWVYSGGYLFQHQGGDETINAQGFSADLSYEVNQLSSSFELFYVQDPIEGIRRRLNGQNEHVFAGGAKSVSAVQFKTGAEIIKTIEPVLVLGYYAPDAAVLKAHTLQTVLAANFYFDTDVRLRFNLDLLLTRNQYTDKYTTNDSRITLELQVRY